MTFSLVNKTAIVTGAGSGIGRTIAIEFAKIGSNIVLVERNPKSLENVTEEISLSGYSALPILGHVRDLNAIERTVGRSIEKFSKIDILVNNAGVGRRENPEAISPDQWNAVVDINLKGTFFFSKIVGEIMANQKSGSIINIASIYGRAGSGSMVHYSASKAGVINLTRSLSMAWAKYNIRVNCIAPGYIWTEGAELMLKSEGNECKKPPRQNAMNRWGKPEEIACVAIFLASDAASFITGQTLFVDGGSPDFG